MVGKLLHIIHTCLDICYVIGLVSHYMQVFQYSHCDVSNIFFNISREPKTLQFAIKRGQGGKGARELIFVTLLIEII